jgi:LysM repeat protein
MAAIIEPQRYSSHARPALQVVPVSTSAHPSSAAAPVEIGLADLGLRLGHAMVAASMVILMVVAAMAISSGALAGLAPAPTGPAAAASDGTTVTVEPGDTLWSIARRVQPNGDVRPLVDQLVAAQGGEVLLPGQQIVVPG